MKNDADADLIMHQMIGSYPRGLEDIYPDLLIMLGFMALFLILNIRALKKYRSI